MATESQTDGGAEQIRSELSDELLQSADEAGVDVQSILESTANEYGSYSPSTQARFATGTIENKIETASAEVINGILVGSRDRYGKNWPRRYSLVRSNGEHIEASSFESRLPGPQGKTKLESPAVLSLACSFNEEYEDWSAERVDSMRAISNQEVAKKLRSVSVPPSELSRTDEYETVAIRGEIAFVNPQTVFRDGEPIGDGPVQMDDDRSEENFQPHMEIALSDDDGTRVRAHLERQRYGEPFVAMPDLEMLIDDALNHSEPEEQAGHLEMAFQGLEVAIVGNVSKYDQSRQGGDVTNYVDIAITGMVALEDTPGSESESSADDAEDVFEDSPFHLGDSADSADSAESENDDVDETSEKESVRDKVELFAQFQDVYPAELTVADIQENAPGIDADEATIRWALSNLTGSTDDASESTDEEADESPTDEEEPSEEASEDSEEVDEVAESVKILEQTRDGGAINCPDEDCLVQEGSNAALMGHIMNAHKPENPAEWVGERIGQ